jgi:DNA-directed RNA polymerase specialized sigma24 family protein
MKSVKRVDALERFESAALPHTADLFRSAMCLLGNASEAEKAVEECLLNAWRSVGEIGSSIYYRPRLYKILFQSFRGGAMN